MLGRHGRSFNHADLFQSHLPLASYTLRFANVLGTAAERREKQWLAAERTLEYKWRGQAHAEREIAQRVYGI